MQRELKITINQLKNYLGTELMLLLHNEEFELVGISRDKVWIFNEHHLFHDGQVTISEIKPICYRISDLDKFIPELGFVPLDEIRNLGKGHCDYLTKQREFIIKKWGFDEWIGGIPFLLIEKLLQWNFWPFGEEYFNEGIIIDKKNYLGHEE